MQRPFWKWADELSSNSKLVLIRGEFEAAQASVDYVEREWSRLHWKQSFDKVEFPQVREATTNSEATYIVRLFSVFESILRDALPVRIPGSLDRRSVYDLINRSASRWRISAAIRDDAHRIREFRNLTVHQNSADDPLVLFTDAIAALNRFLGWLFDTT